MKFLKEEESTKTSKDGKISVTIKQLTTSIQGKVLAMSEQRDIASQLSLLTFLSASAITKVEVNGKKYEQEGTDLSPLDIATSADLGDKATLSTVMQILGLALDATGMTVQDKKKSLKRQSLKKKVKAA